LGLISIKHLEYMKLFHSRIGLALLVVALLAAAFLVGRAIAGPSILRAHTGFLFQQLGQFYERAISSGEERAQSSQEFIDRIPLWPIDWNSCEFRDGTVYDGWGTPVEIGVDSSSIHLRSAGMDRLLNSSDDLSFNIANSSGA
jgi:hypothetical protein